MKPEFNKLWASYPNENHPCSGPWTNQCAIRMSIALNTEGTIIVSKKTYGEPRCEHGHARGAESLANFLWKKIGRPKVYAAGATAKTDIQSKNGIVFFKDCFQRPGEEAVRGDHIDVWMLGVAKTYSDDSNLAKQVWFWTL